MSLLSADAANTRGKGTDSIGQEFARVLQQAKNKGKNGKGKADSGSASASEDTPVECDICFPEGSTGKVRPSSLTFEYNPIGLDSAYQPEDKASCTAGAYPASTEIMANGQTFTVEAGTTFTVEGDFEAELPFEFSADTSSNCFIHASCSVPIVPGDQIGPFIVKGDDSCVPTPPGECPCVICDSENKNRPESLTFKYHADGVDSEYQPEDKATCRAGLYPAATTITAVNKDDVVQSWTVSDGDTFQMDGPFNAETTFLFEADGEGCFIHTSCSVPLVAGDQIGPFEVLEGGECSCGGEPQCVVVDNTEDVCVGDAINVSFDGAEAPGGALPDDWIGIYPCDVPFYLHAVVWQWNCGSPDCTTTEPPRVAGNLTFDSLPAYNIFGPHTWPVPEGCYRAVYLRNDGPSVPPYIKVCESQAFNITTC